MSFFRLEIYGKNKIIELRHIQMDGIHTVEKALKHEKAVKMKKQAMMEGYAFRCRREDD